LIGHSDLLERSASLSSAEARGIVSGASRPGQAADATIVQLRLVAFPRACGAWASC
jgi:hypothetical protein